MSTEFNNKLVRIVKLLRRKVEKANSTYAGKEASFTYHGGFDHGYWRGRLAAYEDVADLMEIDIDTAEPHDDREQVHN
jgi:hypothetical protein